VRAIRKTAFRRSAAGVIVTALSLATAACTTGGHGNVHSSPAAAASPQASAKAKPTADAPRVTISPANGAGRVDPGAGITVTAAGGTLTGVTVRTTGDAVSGQLSRAAGSGTAAGPSTSPRPTR